MGATQYYVDPSIAGDSGSGTTGDPYGDLQYALNTVTRDSTNGDQFNIKAGTSELLSTTLSIATYGTPTATAPLIYRGYTTSANDGGIGVIDMQSNNASINSTSNYVSFIDMELKETGSAVIINLHRGLLKNCTLSGTTNSAVWANDDAIVEGCNIFDCTLYGIDIRSTGTRIINNYLSNLTASMTGAIRILGTDAIVIENIISVSGTTDGILTVSSPQSWMIKSNSVRGGGSTGTGIEQTTALPSLGGIVSSNIVSGFSGAGGVGIKTLSSSYDGLIVEKNYVHDCATSYSIDDTIFENDNEDSATLPFDESGSDTYANRLAYFAPVDTGNIHGGAGNRVDKGAVQHVDPSGGGGVSIVNTRRNSMIGR